MSQDRQARVLFSAPSSSSEVAGRVIATEIPGPLAGPWKPSLELSWEGKLVVDAEGRLAFLNQWLADHWGYAAPTVIGRRLGEFLEPAEAKLLIRRLGRCREQAPETMVLKLRRAEGTWWPILVTFTPLGEKGEFQGYGAAVTDLARLGELERELKVAKGFWETIFESISDNLVVIDPDNCRVVMANQAFLRHLGRSPEEVLKRPCFEVMHQKKAPCQEEGFYCPVQEARRLKRLVVADMSFTAHGKDHVYQVSAYPHLTGEGRVDLVICLERDVTERRRMEESLVYRSQELQKVQTQLAKLYEVARERHNRRSVHELVQYVSYTVRDIFPEADFLFLLLDSEKNRILSLEEGPDQVSEPIKRLLRRLEKVGVFKDFLAYLKNVSEPQMISYADRGNLAPHFKVISRIYPSWLGFPILSQQQCLGFFLMGSYVPRGYSWDDIHFFQALVGQVGCYLYQLLRQEAAVLPSSELSHGKTQFGEIIGQSKKMHEVYELIDLVARTDATVLIMGENGTGKELVARTIHRQSKRSRGPFVVANCSAYSPTLLESELFGHEKGAFTGAIRRKKGRFELAQGGTLFLDEIGDIPPATQVLLLRFLQDHCFERVGGETTIEADVRVLAATNKDLYREVQEGRFRDDLYYRLNVITIQLPPLRERKEDIPLLCQHFLQKYNLKEGKRIQRFFPDAMQTLMDYDWPGNVRQLENAISHAVILAQGEEIRRRHLPRFLKEADDEAMPTSLAESERLLILRVLKEVSWNKHEAARRLRVSRSTLYSKIKRFGLDRPQMK
uniref:PAS domain S-box protein n=1 Tax=Desulfobacca acetoxidans TaxID=60893 RepID=A0A7C5EQ69_9BACT